MKAKTRLASNEIDFVPLINLMARQIKNKKGDCKNERIRNKAIDRRIVKNACTA